MFGPVTITTGISAVESTDGTLSFTGLYSPVNIAGEDRSILFLGEDNNLYYPNAATTIKSFRACFQLHGITAGDPDNNDPNAVRTFRTNFDGEETTGIISTTNYTNYTNKADATWYTINGVRLNAKPTAKGIYIVNGRKVIVK